MQDCDYSLKYVVIGDSGVGKTNIVQRYIENKFNSSFNSTIGVEFQVKIKTYNNIKYKMQIWDTGGQERFRSITNLYYRNTCVVFLVFSYDIQSSFQNLEMWFENAQNECQNDKLIIYLVGNKIDVKNYDVNKEDVVKFANVHKLKYIDISAKTGEGIEELFNMALDDISILIKNNPDIKIPGIKKQLVETVEPKKSCC